MPDEPKPDKQEEEIQARTSPPGQIVYHAIHREGEHELERDSGALAWSGLAAGLSMGFSMVAQALLKIHLPDTRWQPLITKLGYTIGFLIVILGRQQLFTENTLTPILVLLKKKKFRVLGNVARLWAIVLVTNLAGTFAFAWIAAHSSIFDPNAKLAFSEIAREAINLSFTTTLLRAVVAGWLIAMMVWLLPFAEVARVGVIIILSYLVGLGHFSHIVAGGTEVFYLVATSEISFAHSLKIFFLPTLIGNVIGGVSLVAALAHAQFMAAGRGEHS
jgi:formate/nitrite transporter FocA (FNT family)